MISAGAKIIPDYLREIVGDSQGKRQDYWHYLELFERMGRRAASLQDSFNRAGIEPGRCAHLAIDVQSVFCPHNISTLEEPARRIAQKVAPVFNQSGIKTYWFWLRKAARTPNDRGFFHAVKPSDNDVVMEKRNGSAFTGTSLFEKLESESIDTVIVTGFQAPTCVAATLADSCRNGFRTILLTDCTDNESELILRQNILIAENLFEAGVIFTKSTQILNALPNEKSYTIHP